mmetsp:Transcript_23816/g.33352  ORF Transcript_23816/g.33352 Transcript_23816/m.33352 type:complete len:899 (+) Transcript_23816:257-2953(+)
MLANLRIVLCILASSSVASVAEKVHHNVSALPICEDCKDCKGSVSRKVDNVTFHGTEADYVVVGAGTSGSILASRLAEAGNRVILLEAGGTTQREFTRDAVKDTTVFDVPLEWLEICRNPDFKRYQWEVHGTPKVAIAKGIGGCSIHNAMLYMRGVAEDFAEWPEGWQFVDVLPFYTKSENNTEYPVSDFHGSTGPIQVTTPDAKYHDSVTPRFVQAFQELGYSFIDDMNGAVTAERPSETGKQGRAGAGYLQFAIRDGIRDSSAAAYFGSSHPAAIVRAKMDLHGRCKHPEKVRKSNTSVTAISGGLGKAKFQISDPDPNDPSLRRNSLRIIGHSHVTRVLFKRHGLTVPEAVGVYYVRNDGNDKPKCRCSAFARKEVILSAGAINSPKLLMLSGVGPSQHLEEFEIEVIAEVEGVGRNFMDGAYAIVQYEAPALKFERCEQFSPQFQYGSGKIHGGKISKKPMSHIAQCNAEWNKYMEHKRGLYGTPGFFVGGFMQSPGNARPNIQITLHPYDKINQQPWNFKENRRSREVFNACDETTNKHCNASVSKNIDVGRVVTIEVAHNLPKSRGTVRLGSNDPLMPAVLSGNYLSDQGDVDALVWALAQVRTLFNTFSLNEVTGKELLPGFQFQTPEQMERYIKCANTDPDSKECENPNAPVVGHLAGTCKMGDFIEDPLAVVDAQLRVKGVDALRVVDASIMPSLPSGNTHATCMMIAEKAASIILDPTEATAPEQFRSFGPQQSPEGDPNPLDRSPFEKEFSSLKNKNIGDSDSDSHKLLKTRVSFNMEEANSFRRSQENNMLKLDEEHQISSLSPLHLGHILAQSLRWVFAWLLIVMCLSAVIICMAGVVEKCGRRYFHKSEGSSASRRFRPRGYGSMTETQIRLKSSQNRSRRKQK